MNEAAHGRAAVLVIAGTDSSGGAGLTRDVRVFSDFAVDVLCAVTAVTAQMNSCLGTVHHIPGNVIREQISAAFATRELRAVKLGMLGNRAAVDAVVAGLHAAAALPIVLDPVLIATSGGILLDAEGRAALRERLFPLTTLVTPNIPEAAALLDEAPARTESALIAQGRRLLAFGPQAILLKGGHADAAQAVDLLISADHSVLRLAAPRLAASCRGTGCALASAIAARLARGATLVEACEEGKRYVLSMLSAVC